VRYRLRLAANADHCGDRLVDIDRNLALGRLTAGAFRGLGDSLLAQQLRGCLDVAVSLDQRLLAVHHSRAGQLAELLDLARRDRGGHHAPLSTVAGSVAGSGAPASSSVGAASSLGCSAGAASASAAGAASAAGTAISAGLTFCLPSEMPSAIT